MQIIEGKLQLQGNEKIAIMLKPDELEYLVTDMLKIQNLF
ncbi:hypothetical protein HPHPH27_0220 [Helicobacter pylori Hp H-27]|nr:hypothetical protein HPHPH27_0219 [Helicobacter pylori Hp H-27]EJB53606.1 hypothetical protein HPHPH27_0220 [Helicobacter pylori Hp H-27]